MNAPVAPDVSTPPGAQRRRNAVPTKPGQAGDGVDKEYRMNVTDTTAQAHAGAESTELAAQRRASRMAGSLRARALAAIVEAGDDGLTVTELLSALWLPDRRRYSLAPRLSELLREGYVVKGEVREDCVAYVATAAGYAWAEQVAA
jgi:hypothetical protein